MKLFSFILFLFLLSNISTLLKKYKSDNVYGMSVHFESKDFNNNDEMHFKIETYSDNFYTSYDYYYSYNDVEYYYSDINGNKLSSYHHVNFKKTSYEGNYETKYFTITKKKSQYGSSNGDYMVITFPNLIYDWGTVTNTEEDEGKLETWAIILIVVIIVAVIVGVIIYCICRRIRTQKQIEASKIAAANYASQNAAIASNMAIAANLAAQIAAIDNANYVAQQNYQVQQNYQDQQNYQAQVYQKPNYATPPQDQGYTSNNVAY